VLLARLFYVKEVVPFGKEIEIAPGRVDDPAAGQSRRGQRGARPVGPGTEEPQLKVAPGGLTLVADAPAELMLRHQGEALARHCVFVARPAPADKGGQSAAQGRDAVMSTPWVMVSTRFCGRRTPFPSGSQ